MPRSQNYWGTTDDADLIYDHQRYTLTKEGKTGAGAVLMVAFTEADVRATKSVTDKVRFGVEINRLR